VKCCSKNRVKQQYYKLDKNLIASNKQKGFLLTRLSCPSSAQASIVLARTVNFIKRVVTWFVDLSVAAIAPDGKGIVNERDKNHENQC